jgi:hypothetical protein
MIISASPLNELEHQSPVIEYTDSVVGYSGHETFVGLFKVQGGELPIRLQWCSKSRG